MNKQKSAPAQPHTSQTHASQTHMSQPPAPQAARTVQTHAPQLRPAQTEPDLMQDSSELVQYDTPGIPLYVRWNNLRDYPGMQGICHWHEDLELIQIEKGKMNYQINETKLLLEEGDCLLVNSRQMHYGYSCRRQDCQFLCIVFHPSLFTENAMLRRQFVRPFTGPLAPKYLHFTSADPFLPEISRFIQELWRLRKEGGKGNQLEAVGQIHLFWSRLLRVPQMNAQDPFEEAHPDLLLLKDMVSFLARSYPEKLTLDDIARSGNVSRSKCCRLFDRYIQQTPITFLNQYRLKASCRLLAYTKENITDIAGSCGFNHPSYYGKLFQEYYGCTPNQYRRKHQNQPPAHQPPENQLPAHQSPASQSPAPASAPPAAQR